MKNDLRAKTHIPALNRLGACISYDDLMCIDTKWAGDILEEGDEHATLPSNVKSGIFSQVAFDNGDYGQESNSQHITNTVKYQYPKGSFSEETVTYVTKEKSKTVEDLWAHQQRNQLILRLMQQKYQIIIKILSWRIKM